MTRVIIATLSDTSSYAKVPRYRVLDDLIDFMCSKEHLEISTKCKVAIRQSILHSDALAGIIFHHADADTSNNVPTNIILFTRSGHGYLHSYTTQLLLRDMFNLLTPGYPAGKLAVGKDREVLVKAGEVLEFNKHNSTQFLYPVFKDSTVQGLIEEYNSNRSESKLSELSDRVDNIMANISVVPIDKSSIEDIIDYYKESKGLNHTNSSIIDVDYIDDDTAYEVLGILEDLERQATTKLALKSLNAIKSFIRNNSRSKYAICEDRYQANNYIQEDIAR